MEQKVKQVIVIRSDLRDYNGNKVRTGKLVAQGAHASLGVILGMMTKFKKREYVPADPKLYVETEHNYTLTFCEGSYMDKWINGRFTKICVSCSNEEDLLNLVACAKLREVPYCLITDASLTELNELKLKLALR